MKRIYIIAGESSGDFLGSELIKSFKKKNSDIEIIGIGGPLMQSVGLTSLFETSELSVMGLFEVIPSLFRILKRIDQTVLDILSKKPDALITIDSSGFCNRVIKKLKKQTKNIPCIHYVAPQVWAWKPGRAKKLGSFVDHLLCLLPFEPPYFTKHGLCATFVGHPLTQTMPDFIQKDETVQNILILPGSRKREVETLLDLFLKVCEEIESKNPFKKPVQFYLPTLPHLEKMVEQIVQKTSITINITTDPVLKAKWFESANLALAASGTVSLELAKYKIPHVIAYKMNALTAVFLKLFIKVKYASLVNILSNGQIIPECLQENCTKDKIYQNLLSLKNCNTGELKTVMDHLKCPIDGKTPSDLCVDVIDGILIKKNP